MSFQYPDTNRGFNTVTFSYGGISQTLVGWWEMWLGYVFNLLCGGSITENFHSNTFSATVFCTYGGFNFTYGALYLPQIGIAYVVLPLFMSAPLTHNVALHTASMGLSARSFST